MTSEYIRKASRSLVFTYCNLATLIATKKQSLAFDTESPKFFWHE